MHLIAKPPVNAVSVRLGCSVKPDICAATFGGDAAHALLTAVVFVAQGQSNCVAAPYNYVQGKQL